MNETDAREGVQNFIESVREYNFDTLETRIYFGKALQYANEKSVDYVVLTGDLVNGSTINNLDFLDKQFQKVNPLIKFQRSTEST